jgi:thioredoxin reductase
MGESQHVKYLIVGAGPAGLQMAYFLQSRDRDYAVLEKADMPASFFARYPRHRQLISLNKVNNFFPESDFNWRHDWNSLLSDDPEMRFPLYSQELYPNADDLVRYMGDFAKRFELDIRFGQEVASVRADGDGYAVTTTDGDTWTCDVLLLGTGPVSERRPSSVVGADSEGVESYQTFEMDLERYRDKRVAVVGQGNSAFETANWLAEVAAWVHIFAKDPLRMAWDTHFVGDVRSVNNDVIDMFHFKALHGVLTPRLQSVTPVGDVFRTEHEYDFPESDPPGTLCLTRDYDEIIFCAGWNFVPTELFAEDDAPETWHDGKFATLTGDWQPVNHPGCHLIGTAMQGSDRVSASGFIHGFRYNIRTLWNLLEERHEDVPYPSTELGAFDWSAIERRFYERVSVSAALYQQFGTLCDVITVSPDRSEVSWYEELPVKHLPDRDVGDADVFVLTMEYGFHKHDRPSLTFTGPSDPNDPARAAFLHPVVRRLRDGVLDRDEAAEFHFGDSLLGRWDMPHATGGAVMPYHRDFAAWFHEGLGLEAPEVADGEGSSAYRVWSAEEIAQRTASAAD